MDGRAHHRPAASAPFSHPGPQHIDLAARREGIEALPDQRTDDQVAEASGVSRSVLSRIETGESAPKVAALQALLPFYAPPAELADELTKLARESRKRGWWNAGGGADLLDEVRTLVGLETEASMIEEYSGLVVNGLLQIPDYTRALLQGVLPDPDEESIAAAMAYRVKRQERLKDLILSVVIPEEVFLRRVGGAPVMVRQLQHLIEVSHNPQITLQVLDLEAGSHMGIGGAFSITVFPEPFNASEWRAFTAGVQNREFEFPAS
jgi:transcriptional regulator with XRE-family HTH domain